MKIRIGFCSNSSSSSFIICAKENTLEEALSNNYEDIMGISLKDKSSYAINFLKSLKEDWIYYLLYMEDNSTSFHIDEETTIEKITNREEYIKALDEEPPEDIEKLFGEYNIFKLEIYSAGCGGNIIQKHSRFTLKDIDKVNIKIRYYDG
jgi:hypothetical protein